MDLGIAGRNAVICASSRGLGLACALELARAGCAVVVNGRDEKTLDAAAFIKDVKAELEAPGRLLSR